MNTLTAERALLALVALWHQLPFSNDIWSWKSVVAGFFGLRSSVDAASDRKADVESFYSQLGDEVRQRVHNGAFEGCSLTSIIVSADKSFAWSNLPAEAGGH